MFDGVCGIARALPGRAGNDTYHRKMPAYVANPTVARSGKAQGIALGLRRV
jgi:hypothetical protein